MSKRTELETEFVDLAFKTFMEMNKVYDMLLDYGETFHPMIDEDAEPTEQESEFSSLLDAMHNLQAGYGNSNEDLFHTHGLESFYDTVESDSE